MADFQEAFLKAAGKSVANTPELELKAPEAANIRGGIFLQSEVPSGPVRNFLNALLRPPTIAMGLSAPFNSDLFGRAFVFGEP